MFKPSLLICPLDNSLGTTALLPREEPSEESGASLAVPLDKRSFRLRSGPEIHTKKADRKYIFIAMA